MNPKIFVVVAAAALGAVIVGILVAGPAVVASDIPGLQSPAQQQHQAGPAQILPIVILLEDVEIAKITERSATVEVSFTVHNPNTRSVIVQTLDYRLFETSHEEGQAGAISGGQIGTRPEGMVEFGSNYYTLLAGGTITLRDSSTISNPGGSLWQVLESGMVSWRVTGDAFYNLSSMTSGQENRASFDLAHP